MSGAVSGRLDGRQNRTLRSRLAICEACLDLVQEGVLQPSADQIADRAGVSRRSVFNHFVDLAELYDAVVEVGMQRCAPLLEKISDQDDLDRRIDRLVEIRTNFLEATSAFTRALTAQALVGPASEQAIRVSRNALRIQHREVEQLFERELEIQPEDVREEIVEAMSAALSPLQWEYLRRSREIPKARASAILKRMLRSILRDAGVLA